MILCAGGASFTILTSIIGGLIDVHLGQTDSVSTGRDGTGRSPVLLGFSLNLGLSVQEHPQSFTQFRIG